eukprot:9493855-Alexandrium_andersonii.AAC.1
MPAFLRLPSGARACLRRYHETWMRGIAAAVGSLFRWVVSPAPQLPSTGGACRQLLLDIMLLDQWHKGHESVSDKKHHLEQLLAIANGDLSRDE